MEVIWRASRGREGAEAQGREVGKRGSNGGGDELSRCGQDDCFEELSCLASTATKAETTSEACGARESRVSWLLYDMTRVRVRWNALSVKFLDIN